MAATFPYRSPIVVADQELFHTRQVPEGAEMRTRAGQRVGPDDTIARIDQHQVAERIDLAARLDVQRTEIARYLSCDVGATVRKGDVIANSRRGLRSQSQTAPFAGTITGIDITTGEICLAPEGAGDLRALIHGDVIEADATSGVLIHTFGSRVIGTAGLGKPVSGPLRLLAKQPEGDRPGIDESKASGAIIVAPDGLAGATAHQLVAMGAAAIVTGGLSATSLATALDKQVEEILAACRPISTTRGTFPISIMLTEGFGALTMHSHIAETLRALDGRQAALFPETHVTNPLHRPELIVVDPTRLDGNGPAADPAIRAGTRVRLADPARIGMEAIARAEAYEHHAHDGSLHVMVDVQTTNVETLRVPLGCLEVIG